MAEFVGGQEALDKFLKENIKLPETKKINPSVSERYHLHNIAYNEV